MKKKKKRVPKNKTVKFQAETGGANKGKKLWVEREALRAAQINQDKLMKGAACRGEAEEDKGLTKLCYHLYVGTTLFFLTERDQRQ